MVKETVLLVLSDLRWGHFLLECRGAQASVVCQERSASALLELDHLLPATSCRRSAVRGEAATRAEAPRRRQVVVVA